MSRKVRNPKQKGKKLQVIERFINNSKERGEAEDYDVEVDSPLWHVATVFASYKKKRGRKKDPAPILMHLVKNEFPERFENGAEKTLMGMCLELVEEKEYLFLSWLSKAVSTKMTENQFLMNNKDNDFRMKCWSLSPLVADTTPRIGEDERNFIGGLISELESKVHLNDEFQSFLAQVLVASWENFPGATVWITQVFKPTSLDYRFEFLKLLLEVDNISEKLALIEVIVSTIMMKELIEKPEEEWEGLVSEIIGFGFASKPMPLNMNDIQDIPFKKRFKIASIIIKEHKSHLLNEMSFSKLLFVNESDFKKFYDYEIPEGVLVYSIDIMRKGKSAIPEYIYMNRIGVMSVLQSYQGKGAPLDRMMAFVQKIPNAIQDKLHASPGTRAIFRHAISIVIKGRISENNFDSVAPLLKFYRAPFDLVIEVVDKSINRALVTRGNDKNLQQFMLALQSELIESGSDKKSVRKIVDWLKMWSLIYETTKGAEHHAYVAGVLDVIKETKGEFEPRAITEQVLTLLNDDLDRTIRIFKGNPRLDNTTFRRKTDDAKKVLESLKHAYYKLRLMADNQRLVLSEEDRDFMRRVAQELLAFVINIRRQDFIERTEHFAVDIGDVIDPGHLLKSSIERSFFVLLPQPFHGFHLPALIVLEEFLRNPIRIPFVGDKQHGVIINPMFWVFGAAMSLTLMPVMVMTEQTYSNFLIQEYLKTAALAVKKAEEPIGKVLLKVDPNLTAENMIVKSFKQLMDLHLLQGVITREMVVNALTYGGWDVALADKIIEEKDYCVYCSFELPKDAQVCSNCKKPVEVFDLSTIAPEEVEVDLSELGFDVSESGPEDKPPSGGLEVE